MEVLIQSYFILSFITCGFEVMHHISANHISSCGIDQSPMTEVYEGWAKIEHYPWMGYLIYPILERHFTTAVMLVSRQLAIASASEVDRFPKTHFRQLAKVILGSNCSGPQIRVKEYAYHPEYRRTMFNELALIQLRVDRLVDELHPICPPPTHMINPEFYAMSFGEDCKDSRIHIHRMNYVDIKDCRRFYRRNGLNLNTMWPRYTACAKAVKTSEECIWRSGTALVMRQGDRWLLLGFGVYGPGCSSPARFVDYGMYHDWVKMSLLRIGRPAITKSSRSQIIMRRTLASIQRFGPCDYEETKTELYTDRIEIIMKPKMVGTKKEAYYNVTLYAGTEYSCIAFRVKYLGDENERYTPPEIHLKRWCVGAAVMCFGFQFIQIDFYVEIFFSDSVMFKFSAYGREGKAMDPVRVLKKMNSEREKSPGIPKSRPSPISTTNISDKYTDLWY